jgi:hypothetical protein
MEMTDMAIVTTPAIRTALYFKPGGKGRWKLFAVYDTREQAFRAVDQLPDRHPVFRLDDLPAPPPETDPTRDPLEVPPWG